jgi:hypothetical protein
MANLADTFYTFRFLKLLTTSWKKTEAFKEGVIDDKGKLLVKVKDQTNDQKDTYSTFHRLVYNIKRILEKVPFGSSKIKSYAGALFLLREETGMSEEDITNVLDQLGHECDVYISEGIEVIEKGDYILSTDIIGASKGSVVTLENTNHVGLFSGIPIYKTTHGLYLTANNMK